MDPVQELNDCIARNDYDGFLKLYLTLVINRTSLELPKSRVLDTVVLQWRDCMPVKCKGYNDAFLQALAARWCDLMDLHGGVVTPRFAHEVLDLIEKRLPKQKVSSLLEPDPNLNTVELSVSQAYYNDKKARDESLKSVHIHLDLARRAAKMHDVDAFLVDYLSVVIQQPRYKVPKVTILETIQSQWNLVCRNQLKMRPKEPFLRDLAARWFYLLNTKRVPTSQAQLKELLVYIKSSITTGPQPRKRRKKTSWLDKLFRRL